MTNSEIVNYIKKSFELKRQGFYKPAIEMLYKALAIEENNIEILTQLGHLYFLMGNSKRAIHYAEQVFDKQPDDIECLKLVKNVHIKDGDVKQAEEIAKRIFELAPTNENLSERILLLTKLENLEEIKKIEDSGFEFDAETLHNIALAYYKNANVNKAEEILQKSLSKDADNANSTELLAKIYYDKQNFKESKVLFKKLEKLAPNGDVYNYLGLFELEDAKIDKAIKYFTKAYKTQELNDQYVFNLAHSYFLSGWFEEATKLYKRAICLDPTNKDYKYALCYLYFTINDLKNAKEELEELKDYPQAIVLKSLIAAKDGNILKAKKDLEERVKECPTDDFALVSLAKIYLELSYPEKALKIYQNLSNIQPDSLDYKLELGECYFAQKEYNKVLEIVDELEKTNKKYIEAYVLDSKTNYEIEDYKRAFDAAQTAIKLDSNYWKGYYYNALILFETNDENFAVESLKKAILLNPTNAMLYVTMGEFYQAMGHSEDALEYIKEASDIDNNVQNKILYQNLAQIVRKSKNLPSK